MLKVLIITYKLPLKLGLSLLKRDGYKKITPSVKKSVIFIACDVTICFVCIVDMSFKRVCKLGS